ncbi:MAG: DUF615 domain-containing protein [Oxalobacter formigenes]|nr:DUF615 domain-containing protein [Oxalobacter formigenes]
MHRPPHALTDTPPGTPEQEYDRPSKSRRKRDMTALQKLGEQLAGAPAERLKRLSLPENLGTAIEEYRKIKSHEGKRRQLQFIGKIMRGLEETDIAAFHAAIESWRGQSKAETAAIHALERQREKLLADDAALTTFLAGHPHLDRQHLRSLIRQARKEQAESKPPRAYREIFQILKQARENKGAGHAA